VLRQGHSGERNDDEASQRLERSPYWVGTALDPESKWLVVSDVGARTLAMAQGVVHQVAQVRAPGSGPLCVTDGLKEYGTALRTHCGSWRHPERRRDQGPRPKPRGMPRPDRLYAQGVQAYRRRRLVRGKHRVVVGPWQRGEHVLSACGGQSNTACGEVRPVG
jgi:hypothetical protein